MKTLHRIHSFAAATRVVTVGVGILSYLATGSYDSSAEIQLAPSSWAEHCLVSLLRWDALYFNHIGEHGYIYEQEHAFFPGIPLLARMLAKTVLLPLPMREQGRVLLAGVLIANVCFVLAAGMLYRLTSAIQPRLAFVSAIAFCLSPPAMFMSSMYMESPFALLSFTGMWLYTQNKYLLAALIWCFASAIRSNAIVYAGFFIYDLVLQKRSLIGMVRAILYSMITMGGFAMVQYYGYYQFCVTGDRPWCNKTLPLLYSFVQNYYWNNGFLAYYEIKQIPNFLLAMPIILLTTKGLWHYAQSVDGFYTLGLGQNTPADTKKLLPFLYLWGFLLAYATTCMHVQVIIRFFTSLPPLYWITAQIWMDGFKKSASKQRQWLAQSVLSYYVLYGLVGIVLFAAFLPPA
ncbi:gpi mannosyltransferase 2 [Lichtheimia corymbifera JMRC:FSU:9682]|uniref:GPI mannosyltransferase 2 n=1 Tax=Lichtheimia corymbifera JMRC:FSU:9682 TaxID=1263082 RepID=A0A068S7N6_9FUNG|nr:gpi mannosyltransferase 2 [Lichtheimia corymbifera JMRC:FSU:9682]